MTIIYDFIMTSANKNKHNQGSFRARPSGKYEGSRWVNSIGKRITVTADTEAKARTALEAKVRAVSNGETSGRRTKVTFNLYAEQVISQREGIGARTRDKYRTDLRLYLGPLHAVRLDQITAPLLRTTYAALRNAGLSDSVRGHAHTLARLVLETAKNDGLIAINSADVPNIRPKPERGAKGKRIQAYNKAQVTQILAAASQVVHGENVAFLIQTGTRRGEMLGLRWSAVDLKQKTASIQITRSTSGSRVYEGTPKTEQSRREVPLSTPVLNLLHSLKTLNAERHVALYPEQPESLYVFPSMRGTPQRPDNVRRILHQILDLADRKAQEAENLRAAEQGTEPRQITALPRLPVHALRHTFVSLMAEQGQRLEVIAGWIGDKPATMLKIYLHVFKSSTSMPSLNLD